MKKIGVATGLVSWMSVILKWKMFADLSNRVVWKKQPKVNYVDLLSGILMAT